MKENDEDIITDFENFELEFHDDTVTLRDKKAEFYGKYSESSNKEYLVIYEEGYEDESSGKLEEISGQIYLIWNRKKILWRKSVLRPDNVLVTNDGLVIVNVDGKIVFSDKDGKKSFEYTFLSLIAAMKLSPKQEFLIVTLCFPENKIFCFDVRRKELIWAVKNPSTFVLLKINAHEKGITFKCRREDYERVFTFDYNGNLIEDEMPPYYKAISLFKQKQFEKAEELFKSALASDSENSRIFRYLGEIRYNDKDYRKAYDYFMKAKKIDDNEANYIPRTLLKKIEMCEIKLGLKGSAEIEKEKIRLSFNNPKFAEIRKGHITQIVGKIGGHILCLVPHQGKLLLVKENSDFVMTRKFDSHITNIKISERAKHVLVFHYATEGYSGPKKFVLLNEKLEIAGSATFDKLGFDAPPVNYVPRSGMEVSESLGAIIISYMATINFYDFGFNLLFSLKNIYPRMFKVGWEYFKEYEDVIQQIISQIAGGVSVKDVEKAKQIFALDNYGVSKIKLRFKELVKKYHPDVNKSTDAKERTVDILLAYQTLMKCNEENGLEDVHKMEKLSPDRIDWVSCVEVIDGTLFFGGYSGRVVGLDIKEIKHNIAKKSIGKHWTPRSNPKSRGMIAQIESFFPAQNFYFKSPNNDLNVVFDIIFDIIDDDDRIIIKTSSNPFALSYMLFTQNDRVAYKVSKQKFLEEQLLRLPIK